MFDLSELKEPIVQAPLAGGPSTPQLTIAVSDAGGLGFLAAGYKTAAAVREEIAVVRAATSRPFGVNVFVPTPKPAAAEDVREYVEALRPDAGRLGAEVGEPRFDDDDWESKLELVAGEHVPVVSFTFGCPAPEVVERLHAAGVAVWVTITAVEEALAAAHAGADALVAQGTEAGGHRAAFTDDEDAGGTGLLVLLRLLSGRVSLPLIGTGGIADGAALAAVLCAGASAAQLGTALMLTPEAGTSDAQRNLLLKPIQTRLTRAFTGRLARGMVNRFMVEHGAAAPIAYPEIHHATSPLRAAARRSGDADSFNLWAGQAHELARELPAAQIVREIGAEARQILREVSVRMGV